jgi:hypothetical protein
LKRKFYGVKWLKRQTGYRFFNLYWVHGCIDNVKRFNNLWLASENMAVEYEFLNSSSATRICA